MSKTCGIFIAMALSACICFTTAAQQALTPEEVEQRERMRLSVFLPFKYITDFGAENGELNMLQIRPLYTLSTENWNFINRPIIPIIITDSCKITGRLIMLNFFQPCKHMQSSL